MLRKSALNPRMTTTAKHRMTSTKILMDEFLRDIVEQSYEEARLRRIGGFPDRNLILAEIIADVESTCFFGSLIYVDKIFSRRAKGRQVIDAAIG